MSARSGGPLSGWAPVETHHLPPIPLAAGGQSVPSHAGREFIELLCVTARLGAFRSVLSEVVALAEQAPGLSDEQLCRLPLEATTPQRSGAGR